MDAGPRDAAAGSADAKRELRAALLAERRAIPAATLAAASASIAGALRSLPELGTEHATGHATGHATDPRRRQVLLYAADPDEVDLDALLVEQPGTWQVLLPRVVAGDLVAVAHRPGAPLVAGFRGIREPDGEPADLTSIAAVVVPGVAFTADGARLGRGAGMYDRLLPRLPGALRIGVCLERFVRPELPIEPHDAGVDLVVTDASVRRRGDARGSGPA